MYSEVKILALITSATTGQVLFVAMYLWFKNARHLPNKILGLLLFCYSLRIIKSVLLLAFPGVSFAEILIAIGVIGMSAIGPLLFFYLQSLIKEDFRFTLRHSCHFIPLLILLPTAFLVTDKQMFYVYQFSVYQILAYYFYSLYFIVNADLKKHPSRQWIKEILIAVACLSVVFLIQLYSKNPGIYITVSVIAALVFYVMSLRAAFNKTVFDLLSKKKRKNTSEGLLKSIENKLVTEKLYLDSQLSVSKLAHSLKIPAHNLSAIINDETGMNFNEYLNTFRVKEAASQLHSSRCENLSVEGIAYDCGFNSLSAFYSAFKKVYNITPAKFRQQNLPDLQNQENRIEDPARI